MSVHEIETTYRVVDTNKGINERGPRGQRETLEVSTDKERPLWGL